MVPCQSKNQEPPFLWVTEAARPAAFTTKQVSMARCLIKGVALGARLPGFKSQLSHFTNFLSWVIHMFVSDSPIKPRRL